MPSRRRLELEALEDRFLPTGNATGTLSGVAFIDANGNGTRDSGEIALPGVPVFLAGTTTQGSAVNVNTTTDANGGYTFTNLFPGSYQMSAGPEAGLVGGSPSFGAQNAPPGMDITPTFTVAQGQSVTQDFGFQGLTANHISLRLFLTTTTNASLPLPAPGSGQAAAGPRANSAPFVKTPIADVTVPVSSPAKTIDLAANFSDPDITNTTIRINSSAGPINVELFDTQAPQTVANFLDYVNSGAYNNSIFHRLVSNFVLQGGGFTFDSTNNTINTITAGPAVQNEPDIVNRSNVTGTLAMAKLGNDPNSATDQFFFNLADNSSNLNNQNGGFTVFGKVVDPTTDQAVVNTLASATVTDQSSFNSAFNQLPLNNYTGKNFPKDATASNFDLIKNVEIVNQNEKLTYSVVANSNPGLVTPSISNERLTLTYAAGKSGVASITVRATDMFGATVDDTFNITVGNQPPKTGVTLSPAAPKVTDTVTATATPSDPNGLNVKLTYAWSINGKVVKTTTDTASKTDTLDLKTTANVHKGDTITVSVTPNDGVLAGSTATATTTVANSAPVVSVALSPSPVPANSTLTATSSPSDADGDPVTLTYVWSVNGKQVKTTASTASKTDTLDLSKPGNGITGDTISVSVTPNDGTVNGQPGTASTKVS